MPSWQSLLADRFARLVKPQGLEPTADITELRRQIDHWSERFGQPPRDALIEPAQMGTVKGEWMTLENSAAHRVILYFHGGGYVAGSPETHRPLVARLARAAEARTLSVAYRLAPEFPFPAAIRDALEAYRWLLAQGVEPRHVALAGDFSGGGLALALLQAARNANLDLPACAVAMSPWADLALSGWSILTNARRDTTMSWEVLALCARHYLQGASPADAFASPVFGDFRGLPPIMVHAGAEEMLKDDASRIGEQAAKAGCQVSVEIYGAMQHAFQAIPLSPEAKNSLTRMGNFIRMRTPAPQRRRT